MPDDAFSGGNNPYGEHAFSAIDHAGSKIFWKIDYNARMRLAELAP